MSKNKKLQLNKTTIQDLQILRGKDLEKVQGGSNMAQMGTTNLPIFC